MNRHIEKSNPVSPTEPVEPDSSREGDAETVVARRSKAGPYDFSILRNLRKAQGFTIADIAQASGISTAVISRIERNQAVPELDTLFRLGKAFGITATDLLGLAEFRTSQTTSSQHYVSGGFQFQNINFMNLQCFLGSALAGGNIVELDFAGQMAAGAAATAGGQRLAVRREVRREDVACAPG